MRKEDSQDSGNRVNDSNMKADSCPPVPLYKEILKQFEFAQPFLDDPDVFNTNSKTLRNFLIQAFAFIHSDFHYISFSNKEIDQEIIRAAEILQILPIKPKKSDELFGDFSDAEIRMFWKRLFRLLDSKKDSDFCIDITETAQEKFGFLKDISKTLDYVHREFPVVKKGSFNNEILDKEIENWSSLEMKCNNIPENSSIINYDALEVEHINNEQLLMDLEQTTSMLKNMPCYKNTINKPEHLEFFSRFTSLAQNTDQRLMNLTEINSSFLDELHHKMFSEPKPIQSSKLYFLKRCNNFFKTLEFKNKFSV